ncbi:MAG: formylglycine-generating enzyme family protein [Gemmataceae bacterium]
MTQAQWRTVMGDNPSKFKGDNLPVENVSWDDCQVFCRKLGEKTGKRFRLPTEAEWEYACRAGTTTPFHFGATISTDQANYDGTSTFGGGTKGAFRAKTMPVGSFPANAWGLYDMHGNVDEWCQNRYGAYREEDLNNPKMDSDGAARVLRGGSWNGIPGDCRAAYRFWDNPGYRDAVLGCRVLLCVDEKADGLPPIRPAEKAMPPSTSSEKVDVEQPSPLGANADTPGSPRRVQQPVRQQRTTPI